MFTQGFGEVLTDILTVNPAIAKISSASSILDVSNYTFNAVTLGKDAEGFSNHGHGIINIDLGPPILINDGVLKAVRGNSISPSSYHTSAVHLILSSTYNSIPQYPSIYDTKLENKSTLTPFELLWNNSIAPSLSLSSLFSSLGHYRNPGADIGLSSLWNVIGGYPPSGNISYYQVLDLNGNFVFSGTLSGVFNSKGIIDSLGYIKINENFNVTSLSSGPYITSAASFTSNPAIILGVGIQKGDAASLALFGGVNHIGIWCLDLKEMLKSGLTPPYSWNNLNNTRKYKLVAKVTFWNDLLYQEDTNIGGTLTSGIKILEQGLGANEGVLVKLKFNFR